MATHKKVATGAPVAPADQARFDAVTQCRARVDELKRTGVEPSVLEMAVEELQAAVAAAPDMPAPPPPVQVEAPAPAPEPIDPTVASNSAANEQEI